VQINRGEERQGNVNWNTFLYIEWKSSILMVFLSLLCAIFVPKHIHKPESLLSSYCLSLSLAPLSVVYIFCFFLSLLNYSLCALHPTHATWHKLYEDLYAHNFILSSHTHFIGIWILLWFSARCSGMWILFEFFHVKLIRILPALDFITQLLKIWCFRKSVLRLRLVEI
jgi:hypothetical protein